MHGCRTACDIVDACHSTTDSEGVLQTPRIAMASSLGVPRLDLATRHSSHVSPTGPEALGPLDEEQQQDHTLAVCQDLPLEVETQTFALGRSTEDCVSQTDSEPLTSPHACCSTGSFVHTGGVQAVLQRLQEGQARLADVQGELQEMQIRVLTYVEDKLQEHRETWRTELAEEVGKQVTSALDTKCGSCDRGAQLHVEHGMTKASTCISLHEVLQSRIWEQRAAAQEKEIESIRSDVARHAMRFSQLETGLRVTIDSSVEEVKRIQKAVNAMIGASDSDAKKLGLNHSPGKAQLSAPQSAGALQSAATSAHECSTGDTSLSEGLPLSSHLSFDWSRLTGSGHHTAQRPVGTATLGGVHTGGGWEGIVSPAPAPASPTTIHDRPPRRHAMTPLKSRPLGAAATARIPDITAGTDPVCRVKSSERSSSVPTSPSRVSMIRETRSLVAPAMSAAITTRPSARQVVTHVNNRPPQLGLFEQEEGGSITTGQFQPQEAAGRHSACHTRFAEGMYMLTAQSSPVGGSCRVMTRSTHPIVSPVQMLCHKNTGNRITHPSTPSMRVRNMAGL